MPDIETCYASKVWYEDDARTFSFELIDIISIKINNKSLRDQQPRSQSYRLAHHSTRVLCALTITLLLHKATTTS